MMNMNKNFPHSSINKERIKRSSKIPLCLKNQFLMALVSEDVTIKDVARRFNINYSTAKAIVKENKKFIQERSTKSDDEYHPGINFLENRFRDQNTIKGPVCGYIDIAMVEDLERVGRGNNISIISTVAWDFLQNGLP